MKKGRNFKNVPMDELIAMDKNDMTFNELCQYIFRCDMAGNKEEKSKAVDLFIQDSTTRNLLKQHFNIKFLRAKEVGLRPVIDENHNQVIDEDEARSLMTERTGEALKAFDLSKRYRNDKQLFDNAEYTKKTLLNVTKFCFADVYKETIVELSQEAFPGFTEFYFSSYTKLIIEGADFDNMKIDEVIDRITDVDKRSGIGPRTVRKLFYLLHFCSKEEAFPPKPAKYIDLDGEGHDTLRSMASKYGVNYRALSGALRRGHRDLKTALTLLKKEAEENSKKAVSA